jgi:hypothetical protein
LVNDSGSGGNPRIAAAATGVCAYAFTNPASPDSAVLITLPLSGYTAWASITMGRALMDVYKVP